MSEGLQLYDVREAAGILRVSERTLRRMIRRGQIGYVRVGRAIRFSADVLRAYVDRQAVLPPEETP